MSVEPIKNYLLTLQNHICKLIENEDGKAIFHEDKWLYKETQGGGITKIMTEGAVIEKGGVNFSHVFGAQLPNAATANRPELTASPFEALGVSVVMHPQNPFAPTSHFNVRYISVETPTGKKWWFGGGFDLTPYYGFDEDCIAWHQAAKNACDPFGENVYAQYKKWCDDYFFLKHRNEARGIGGLFFDDLCTWDFTQCFDFIKNVSTHYVNVYQQILNRRKNTHFTEKEREFQLYRRGRYVEFNLLYDRGTLFGLQSGGRTESILMSLPPKVRWNYNYSPKVGSDEAKLYDYYLIRKNWL